jgi:hypothetical protein
VTAACPTRSSTRFTVIAAQLPPRAVGTPRAFNASAISARVRAPAACTSRRIGSIEITFLPDESGAVLLFTRRRGANGSVNDTARLVRPGEIFLPPTDH